ncbi:MAG: hypothetical protein NTW87_30025 [Planctomycetota bacterium]|nr:hypothetical protein [Planctomycetota bacterium]
MGLEFLNASAVVAAEGHNPTILHPAFLESRSIVPKEWKASEVICTPPVAVVKYNGQDFIMSVEIGRLQVIDNKPGDQPEKSPAPQIAAKYITELPHVRYTAVGINFTAFVPSESAERRLLERFLKPDDSWQGRFAPKAIGLRFLFDLVGGALRLRVDAGTVKRGDQKERSGVLVNANCNYDLPTDKKLERAVEILSRFADNYQVVRERINAVLGLGT